VQCGAGLAVYCLPAWALTQSGGSGGWLVCSLCALLTINASDYDVFQIFIAVGLRRNNFFKKLMNPNCPSVCPL
jgi:hypothetical protein